MDALEFIRKAIKKNKCCVHVRDCAMCDHPLMLFITTDEEIYLSTNCECVKHFSPIQKKPIEFLQKLLDNHKEDNNASSEEKQT